MIKDEQLSDEPLDPDCDGNNPHISLQHIYTSDLPEVHEIIRSMRTLLNEYDECIMAEENYLPNVQFVTDYV